MTVVGRAQRRQWLAGLLVAVVVISLGGTLLLNAAGCPAGTVDELLITYGSGLAFSILGTVIVRFRSENRIGWLCLFIGVCMATTSAAENYARCGLGGHLALPAVDWLAWLSYVSPFGIIFGLFILLPLWFPDGRFLSPRWKRAGFLLLSTVLLVTILTILMPGPMQISGLTDGYSIDNPLGLAFLSRSLEPLLRYGGFLVVVGGSLMAVLSFVHRWRRSSGETRQQLKWLAYFLATAVTIQLLAFEVGGGLFYPAIFDSILYSAILLIVFIGFPVVIGVAIFKYRLYDIDLIIRRTLVYAILSAALALVYFVSVTVLQSLVSAVSGQRSPVVIVVSTLVIAALFAPLRGRVQDFIDRRFYRRKYDAAQVLAQFAVAARNEVDLESLTAVLQRTVAEAMQPIHMTLWLQQATVVQVTRKNRTVRQDQRGERI